MSRIPLNTVVNFRDCGSCQACCEVLGIKELGKPMWTRCEHQIDGRCDIYDHAPLTCRGYECLWRLGILDGDERRRPDHIGVILDFRGDGETISTPEDIRYIQLTEVWAGAAQQPNVVWMLNQIRQRYAVEIRQYGIS